jgi:uncharacterized protein YggE
MRQKRTWVLLAVVLLLTAIIVPTSYAEVTTPAPAAQTIKTMEITGTGRVSYSYDTAQVTLGVSELADSPSAAFKAMTEKITKVVASASAKGIMDANLKTGNLSLYQETEWKDGVQTIRGYRATNTVTIKVKDLTQVASIMEMAVTAGANQVQGVTFSLADPSVLEGQAIDAAIDNARAQADRAAKKLGTSVKGVQKVTVMNQSGPIGPMYMKGMDYSTGSSPAVYSGSGEYNVSVAIVYEIQ